MPGTAAKVKGPSATAAEWCAVNNLPFTGKQIAAAFVWRGLEYLKAEGKVCFILPHGLLFNHAPLAVQFQQHLFKTHAVELVPQHGNGISRSRDFAYTSPVLDCEAKEVTIAREGGEGQGQREAVGGFAGTQSVAHGGEGDCAACVDLGAGVSGALE